MKTRLLSASAVFLASILILSGMNLGYSQSSASDGRTVNTIAVVTIIDPDRTVTTVKQGTFSYIFEACAGSNDIRSPEVIVSSDSESKKIKLSHDLKAGECQTSVSKIKASSKEKISAQVVDRGGVTKIIKDLEIKITEVKEKMKIEKANLKQIINEKPEPVDSSKKISDITDKIVKLRKELKDAREAYYRTLILMHN